MADNEPVERWNVNRNLVGLIVIASIIFAPFTYGMSLIIGIFGIVVAYCIQTNEDVKDELWEISTEMEEVISYDEELPDPIDERKKIGAPPAEMLNEKYVFPTKCPFCGYDICLGNIEWIDDNAGICPNCKEIIKAEKV